jgi:hypothetical protein
MDMDMDINDEINNDITDYSWQQSVIDYIRIQGEGYCALLKGPKGCGKSHLAHIDPDIIFIEEDNLYNAEKEIILTLMYISRKSNSKIILICNETQYTKFTDTDLNSVYFNNNIILEEL